MICTKSPTSAWAIRLNGQTCKQKHEWQITRIKNKRAVKFVLSQRSSSVENDAETLWHGRPWCCSTRFRGWPTVEHEISRNSFGFVIKSRIERSLVCFCYVLEFFKSNFYINNEISCLCLAVDFISNIQLLWIDLIYNQDVAIFSSGLKLFYIYIEKKMVDIWMI